MCTVVPMALVGQQLDLAGFAFHRAFIARSDLAGHGRGRSWPAGDQPCMVETGRTGAAGPYLQGRCRGFESLRAHRALRTLGGPVRIDLVPCTCQITAPRPPRSDVTAPR
jgi:hypothetical protein